MTSIVAALKLPPVERRVVNYSVRTRLKDEWSVIGTGKEQITCVDETEPGWVAKIIISALAPRAQDLSAKVDQYSAFADVVHHALGEFDAETTYSVEPLDAAGTWFGVVGRQERMAIVDSVFHQGGALSPAALTLPFSVRQDFVERVRRLHEASGYLVDVLGVGNLVLAEGHAVPVLVDNIPIYPCSGGPPASDVPGAPRFCECRLRECTFLRDVESRLHTLLADR